MRNDMISDLHWESAAGLLDWDESWDVVKEDAGAGRCRWFPRARINTCHNALDRHIAAGHGDRQALIFDSTMTGDKRIYSYTQLRDAVAKAAGAFKTCGVQKGDRVILYMPMIPEAAIAMLACARIGAVHSVVFGGFAAAELARRIDDAKPQLIVSASCGFEPGKIIDYKALLDGALSLSSHQVPKAMIVQRSQQPATLLAPRDVDWEAAITKAIPVACVSLASSDPLYILYTSGTTGVPKGVVRDNGGHAVAMAWSMANIYGASAGDVFWAASDIGWVVGHSYIVYGPLIAGCTTVLYEGKPVGTPDAGAFWRMVEDYNVNILFTAPTAIRAIRAADPGGELIKQHTTQSLRHLFLAGERADAGTVRWAQAQLSVPVIDHWWQTELGWPAIATCIGSGDTETRTGSAGKPVPGFAVQVVDDAGNGLAPGDIGNIVIKLPLPPGCLTTLWNNDDGYRSSYFDAYPGYYATGDAGMIDADGFVHVMSRTDDIINVAGHRLSTGGIEQILATHPDVAECAVVGAADELKGQVPVGFAVLTSGAANDRATIEKELIALVRSELGPVAAFKTVAIVSALPKTRSGKILRSTMRHIVDGTDHAAPATIENPEALGFIRAASTRLRQRK